MGALGDQEAEVEGGAGDALRGVLGAVCPQAAGRARGVRRGRGRPAESARARRRRSPGSAPRARPHAAAGRWVGAPHPGRRPHPAHGPRSPSGGPSPWRPPTWAGRTRGSAPWTGRPAAPSPVPYGTHASVRAVRRAGVRRPPRHRRRRRCPGAASAFSTRARKPSASVTASRAERSVQARWAIWWATVQPGAGVASDQRGVLSPATRRSSSSLSSRRSSITDVGSDTGAPLGARRCAGGLRGGAAC